MAGSSRVPKGRLRSSLLSFEVYSRIPTTDIKTHEVVLASARIVMGMTGSSRSARTVTGATVVIFIIRENAVPYLENSGR